MILKIELEDKLGNAHVLNYHIYDTPLSKKWADITERNLANPDHSIHGVFNNLTNKDIPEIFSKLTSIITDINKEYDKKLPIAESYDNKMLNYLHEEFEVFGGRLDEAPKKLIYSALGKRTWSETLKNNFFALNESIHACEDALMDTDNTWGPAGILYDLHPLGIHEPVTEEDKLYLRPDFYWGKLYLGYNTLGKDWLNVYKDNDIEVIDREMVKPQRRYAAETWLNFCKDQDFIQKVTNFVKWCKSLPEHTQSKIPLNNINELTLGRFLIGELIIDDQFLKHDSVLRHWQTPGHPCKLKWNKTVLSTFRKVTKICLMKQ
jgi:hypothetical protein